MSLIDAIGSDLASFLNRYGPFFRTRGRDDAAIVYRYLCGLAAHWLTVEWLLKYAPELNDIERVWRDLKAHHLAHSTFGGSDALDRAIHDAVEKMNVERNPVPLEKQRTPA